MCVMSCPYGILKPDDRTKQDIIKCDLCKEEDIPLCVYNCPSGALELQSEEVELSSDVATTSQENIKTYVIVGARIRQKRKNYCSIKRRKNLLSLHVTPCNFRTQNNRWN